jgi:hypothetical protein
MTAEKGEAIKEKGKFGFLIRFALFRQFHKAF